MKRVRSCMCLVVCIVALFGLGWAPNVFSGQFPPKKICLVTDPGDDLVLVATSKPAGGWWEYKFYSISGVSEIGPLVGTGAVRSGYMDIFLTGGVGSFYMLGIRLDSRTSQGSYKWRQMETGMEETGSLRLEDCKNFLP